MDLLYCLFVQWMEKDYFSDDEKISTNFYHFAI